MLDIRKAGKLRVGEIATADLPRRNAGLLSPNTGAELLGRHLGCKVRTLVTQMSRDDSKAFD